MSIASERANDLVIFEGLTTGKAAGHRIGNASRRLGQFTGQLIVVDFPTMMAETRTNQKRLQEIVNGRQIKTHSAGSLVLASMVEHEAEPLSIDIYNEVVAAEKTALIKGGLKRAVRHGLHAVPGIDPHPIGNLLVAADTAWQSVRHGPSNFGHLSEISKYTAADHIEILAERETDCRRLVGALDEFKDYTQVREIEGAPVVISPTCHDGLLVNPYDTLEEMEHLQGTA